MAADRALTERDSRDLLRTVPVIAGRFGLRDRLRHRKTLTALFEFLLPLAVGHEVVVADTLKPLWQDVK